MRRLGSKSHTFGYPYVGHLRPTARLRQYIVCFSTGRSSAIALKWRSAVQPSMLRWKWYGIFRRVASSAYYLRSAMITYNFVSNDAFCLLIMYRDRGRLRGIHQTTHPMIYTKNAKCGRVEATIDLSPQLSVALEAGRRCWICLVLMRTEQASVNMILGGKGPVTNNLLGKVRGNCCSLINLTFAVNLSAAHQQGIYYHKRTVLMSDP